MEEEKRQLQQCRQHIEQLLNWGNSDNWRAEEYEELSQKIFDKTQVQLSVSTLKRIWGKVKYTSFPSLVTLNALARFADYNSWREFKLSQISPDLPVQSVGVPQEQIKLNPMWMIAAALISCLLLLWVSAREGKLSAQEGNKELAKSSSFSSRKVSDDLPNSVVFNYHTNASIKDSVYIRQSWDPKRTKQVSASDSIHTSIYYHPGYFLAKLIVNHSILKEIPVFIKTKGWKGIIDRSPIPVYLSASEIRPQGTMGITGALLQQKTGSPVFNGTWVKFSNIKEYPGIDGGNFSLTTTLRNTSTPEQSVCRKVKVVILGIGKAIVIPLSHKGCTADIGLLAVEDWIEGKTADLSSFGCDFNQFQQLRCELKDKTLRVYLNGKQVFSKAQTHSLGRIVGLRLEFEGSGQVKDLKLESPGTKPFDEHF
ncbi:hypothetical protein [Pedobacter caeni]|uniref:Uncharacterized protein n=1 Tax=Pedobacter caeni TaxID=288992 RepID=A0A1M5BKZ0_9SPHI|nr:hypothetical protein [Pedobacter caeni]SHF43106.1 hypothetical protein SAMN04488522_1021241 [Pedobacter caeni]